MLNIILETRRRAFPQMQTRQSRGKSVGSNLRRADFLRETAENCAIWQRAGKRENRNVMLIDQKIFIRARGRHQVAMHQRSPDMLELHKYKYEKQIQINCRLDQAVTMC